MSSSESSSGAEGVDTPREDCCGVSDFTLFTLVSFCTLW